MIKANKYLKDAIEKIVKNGYMDEKPRPRWHDGTPAHTLSINGMFREYDVNAGEFPVATLRPIAWKTGIKEIFAIYQNQSNKISEFERLGCGWWKDWEMEDHTIGLAYPYNIESRLNYTTNHTQDQPFDVVVAMHTVNDSDLATKKDAEIKLPHYNFTPEEFEYLCALWHSIPVNQLHKDWETLDAFLNDVRYIPQYFLAKENQFEGWTLSLEYYRSNAYGPSTCVFLTTNHNTLYQSLNALKSSTLERYELSRNQVVELLNGLRNNPYGRRHIVSFWNWANINKKALVECAYETIWNIRNQNGEKFLDMTLIQRSGDLITASCSGVNETQYVALMLMVSAHCGYKPGVFRHYVANEQIYDRYIEVANELLSRYEMLRKEEESHGLCKEPQLVFHPEAKDFFNYTINDFEMKDYNPMKPQLKFEVAV